MKKMLYTLVITISIFASSCDLETEPTGKVSREQVFESVESAQSAINGIYRSTYIASWSSLWSTENFGITAVNLMADLMGEDHLMASGGSGWFIEDYKLNVYQDYIGKSGRSYALWNFYYTVIGNANYILASEGKLSGDQNQSKSIMGQAYAMRAYAYFYLAQLYQQTYVGNENKPGLPIYTKPTTNETIGQPRGTLEDTYKRINEDIDKAIVLLKESGVAQAHKSHIDQYVASGIKARVALVQQKYADAKIAATNALSKPGLAPVSTTAQSLGFNSITIPSTLWGFEIIADQSTAYSSFFSHMDADGGLHASTAPKCISSWLYGQIPTTDARKSWFRGSIDAPKGGTSYQSYCQVKFAFKDKATRTGDYIVMRAEEMLLIKAEAECQLGEFTNARKTLSVLGSVHDSDYAARLAKFTDSKEYNTNTIGVLSTLMDEILFQRRVELWGESGRIFDLQRLKLGYNRDYTGSNHTRKLLPTQSVAGSAWFIMVLPQSEFDGNKSLTPADQNPFPEL